MSGHAYMERYRQVWERTLSSGALTEAEIAKSRYYFEADLSTPRPKKMNTYGIVALMPPPAAAQDVLQKAWEDLFGLLGQPCAYAVEPPNRHVELMLFARPEEASNDTTTQASIEASFAALERNTPHHFQATFNYPFITPDGTVVVPGFPGPASSVDDFRTLIRDTVGGTTPKKQSNWFHISLGRILEPLSPLGLRAAFKQIEEKWGERLFTCEVNQVIWTHEKQWYMVDKDILHRLDLQ